MRMMTLLLRIVFASSRYWGHLALWADGRSPTWLYSPSGDGPVAVAEFTSSRYWGHLALCADGRSPPWLSSGRQVMDPSRSQITIPAENSHASSTVIDLKVSSRRSLLLARRAVSFQESRLAIVHSRDRCALSETCCICPAGVGEHCDATIRIFSTMGAANAAGPALRRVTVYRDINLIFNGISGNRVRAHG